MPRSTDREAQEVEWRTRADKRHGTVCMTATKVLEVLLKVLQASMGTKDRRKSRCKDQKGSCRWRKVMPRSSNCGEPVLHLRSLAPHKEDDDECYEKVVCSPPNLRDELESRRGDEEWLSRRFKAMNLRQRFTTYSTRSCLCRSIAWRTDLKPTDPISRVE